MKVYILSTYQEDGAKEVMATLDRSKLLSMLETWGEPEPEELERLADAVKADLVCEDGTNLSNGWGGIMLHIVELT